MYENKPKNPFNTKIDELELFIQLIADLDEDIELFAMGGTAMVMKNIKEVTKDIDFLTTSDYTNINKLFKLAGLKEESNSRLCNIWRMNKTRIDIILNCFLLSDRQV